MTGLLLSTQFPQSPGRPFADTVLRQPELLDGVLPRLVRAVETGRLADPGPAAPIAFAAIGASRAACWPAVWELLRAGRWAQRFTGEELAAPLPGGAVYVGVSQSGRSPEPLHALQRLRGQRIITVTNEPDSPMSRLGDAIGLGSLPDSGVSTVAYSATSAVLSMLAERWIDGHVAGGWEALALGIGGAIERASTRMDEWVDSLRNAETVDVVGSGQWRGPAEALALAIREALHVPAAAFDTRSYLHGQTDSISPTAAQILLGDERERILRTELAGRSLGALQLSAAPWALSDGVPADTGLLGVPGESPGQQAVAGAAMLHDLVRRWGAAIGVDPDTPVFVRLDTKAAG